ncbi:MAG: hypothetical protein AAFY98_05330 [Verrucomicrobiota bacterium]
MHYRFAMTWRMLVMLGLSASTAFSDVLTLVDGETLEGKIISKGESALTVEVTRGGGKAQLQMPLERIEAITFDSHQAKTLEELKALWIQREPYLEMKGADSSEVGIAYASALIATGDVEQARVAVELTETIQERATKKSDQINAAQVRLSALAAAGEVDRALAEAQSLESLGSSETDELAKARVRNRFVQAEVAWKAKQQLESDWPKWHLMPEKRAERRKLINQALDQYLFPVAHHADLNEFCAEGLARAMQIYQDLGMIDEAVHRAEEIVNHFPAPAYLGVAEAFLNQHKSKEDKTDV